MQKVKADNGVQDKNKEMIQVAAINSGASINSTALIIERSGDAHPQSGTVPGKISLSGINFRDRLIQLAQTERNKNFTPNPSRRNGGKLPQILKYGTAENYPES